LNLDLLATSNFRAVERDALERARVLRLGRSDVERNSIELNVVKATRQQRADRRSNRTCRHDRGVTGRKTTIDLNRFLALYLDLALHADRRIAERTLAGSDRVE